MAFLRALTEALDERPRTRRRLGHALISSDRRALDLVGDRLQSFRYFCDW